ncbi:deoxyribose-phosphate aldolase [Microbacterium sp. KUDC0406]|uniref:class I fructose-bisphosphate aldolase n=1 Tax=Microbacterium sp. KUDC0406 TaxID=2909588 RepID=UPI001F476E86|nr:deoxyribose-phosphate aldolase [Microbacterium sp. KUDC0406]UJP09924.1 deoxyribose-phosphate aldolase [Microbacterium sp. KUDC0406]
MHKITPEAFAHLRDTRAIRPDEFATAFAQRRRRPVLGADGRLFIVAADHPARGALSVGDDAMAMADRYVLLERLALALSHPGVDGVLGTPDIIDDLALLGALDDKVVVGSMNRGGLRGSTFEIDDRYTAYDVPTMVGRGIDFAKALIRIDLGDPATADTLDATADVVTAAASAGLPIMLEPFLSHRRNEHIVNDLTTDAVITSIAIASALGADSSHTWMKLPVVEDMERVVASTTMPVLLLGGDSGEDPDERFASWESALTLPGVRGLTVGRTLLFPPDGDVLGAVDVAARMVHPSIDAGASAGDRGAHAIKERA